MLSRFSPPFFASPSWQSTQYLFTTESSGELTGNASRARSGCAVKQKQVTNRIQHRKRIPRRNKSAQNRQLGTRFFTCNYQTLTLDAGRGNKKPGWVGAPKKMEGAKVAKR